MSTRDVTRWLTRHRRKLAAPETDEVRALYQGRGLPELYQRRVVDSGLVDLPPIEAHPPALVHELLRRGGLTLSDLDQLSGPDRTHWGLVLGVAAALTAGGLLAGGVPSSRGALEGIADAIRRSNALLQ